MESSGLLWQFDVNYSDLGAEFLGHFLFIKKNINMVEKYHIIVNIDEN